MLFIAGYVIIGCIYATMVLYDQMNKGHRIGLGGFLLAIALWFPGLIYDLVQAWRDK